MENKNRVYGKKIDINKENVKEFWNKRAQKYNEENPYNAVKCNDNDKEYVNTLDEYEKNVIIPKLNINESSKILDVGCGIGRLAEILYPKSNYYLGTDFAEDLLKIAKERIVLSEKCDFEICDFIDVSDNIVAKTKGPFNKIILAGVAMYINDDELKKCFKGLLSVLDKKTTIYLSGPIGIEKRLTLDTFYSEQLKSQYDVIYRTIDEYKEILSVFTDNGFEIVESKDFLTHTKQYSDTERHYFILERS